MLGQSTRHERGHLCVILRRHALQPRTTRQPNERASRKSTKLLYAKTHLDEKEKGNMIWVELKRNVAHATARMYVPLSDKSHKLCNVANDG